jgi:uncharacterized protein YxjI
MTSRQLQFPLTLRMKLIALAPQFFVEDANQQPVAYIKQKLFKLKEAINIFADETQKEILYTIAADRIIDFSARYNLKNASGLMLGAVKRMVCVLYGVPSTMFTMEIEFLLPFQKKAF